MPLIGRNKRHLFSREKVSGLISIEYRIISTYVNMISIQEVYSLKGISYRWEVSSIYLKENDLYCFENFKYALSQIPRYLKRMDTCGPRWLGLTLAFPLILWRDRKYERIYRLTKKEERDCCPKVVAIHGFLQTQENPESSFNLNHFHRKSLN